MHSTGSFLNLTFETKFPIETKLSMLVIFSRHYMTVNLSHKEKVAMYFNWNILTTTLERYNPYWCTFIPWPTNL
jgi:hypothetical protein